MITKEELQKFVQSRSWYQTIQFEDDVMAKGCAWCGEPAWSNIVKFLPDTLEGMRILDLGCNAGLFCVRSALMGAKEIVGIDWTGWRPKWDFEEQQAFVMKYFEEKFGKKLPITYISGKMEEILQTRDLGQFDYIFAIASIYYTAMPDETVKAISKIGKNVIVRLRDENRIAKFTGLFKAYGYKEEKVMQEKWWEKLNHKTDDFYLYLYSK